MTTASSTFKDDNSISNNDSITMNSKESRELSPTSTSPRSSPKVLTTLPSGLIDKNKSNEGDLRGSLYTIGGGNNNNTHNNNNNNSTTNTTTTMNTTNDITNNDTNDSTIKNESTDSVSTEPIPPRKRSKVSRACDDCRRKKIRCDAEDKFPSGNSFTLQTAPQCSSCRRSGVQCSFSRIPMKRGPSKRSRSDSMGSENGRRTSISSNGVPGGPVSPHHRPSFGSGGSPRPLQLQQSNGQPTRLAAIASPGQRYERLPSIDTLTGAGGISPKGSTSGASSSPSWQQPHSLPTPPQQSQTQPQSTQQQQQQQHSPILTTAASPLPAFTSVLRPGQTKPRASSFNLPVPSVTTPNINSHPNSHGNNYFSKAATSSSTAPYKRSTRHSSISSVDSFESGSNSPYSRSNSNASVISISDITNSPNLPGWNERYIDSYYQLIHATLPVLPSSKLQLRKRLEHCQNPDLRYALLSCISGLIYSSENSRNVSEIAFYRNQTLQGLGNSSVGFVDEDKNCEIIRLMTLILFYLQTKQSCWLGSAITQAYSMSLHVAKGGLFGRHGSAGSVTSVSSIGGGSISGSISPGEQDIYDDDSKISRRLFLVLVILDRMHTAVHSNIPLQIPDQYVTSEPDDLDCFSGNRSNVEMVKLCLSLGRVSKLIEESRPSGTPESRSILRLCGDLDGIGRSLEGVWDTVPILKAVYYFARLILDRVAPTANIINDATTLGFLMDSPLVSVSPLLAYFIPVLIETLRNRSQDQLQSKSSSPTTQTEMSRLYEFLDRTIERKFPEYEAKLRSLKVVSSPNMGISQQQQQSPSQPTPSSQSQPAQSPPPQPLLLLSNHQRLEGLAHVAHLAER